MVKIITKYEIEHHFEWKDVIPEDKWVCNEVPIVKLEEKGEVLFEHELRNKEKLRLGFGGLVIGIEKVDFVKEVKKIIFIKNQGIILEALEDYKRWFDSEGDSDNKKRELIDEAIEEINSWGV